MIGLVSSNEPVFANELISLHFKTILYGSSDNFTGVVMLIEAKEAGLITGQDLEGCAVRPAATDGHGLHLTQHLSVHSLINRLN